MVYLLTKKQSTRKTINRCVNKNHKTSKCNI